MPWPDSLLGLQSNPLEPLVLFFEPESPIDSCQRSTSERSFQILNNSSDIFNFISSPAPNENPTTPSSPDIPLLSLFPLEPASPIDPANITMDALSELSYIPSSPIRGSGMDARVQKIKKTQRDNRVRQEAEENARAERIAQAAELEMERLRAEANEERRRLEAVKCQELDHAIDQLYAWFTRNDIHLPMLVAGLCRPEYESSRKWRDPGFKLNEQMSKDIEELREWARQEVLREVEVEAATAETNRWMFSAGLSLSRPFVSIRLMLILTSPTASAETVEWLESWSPNNIYENLKKYQPTLTSILEAFIHGRRDKRTRHDDSNDEMRNKPRDYTLVRSTTKVSFNLTIEPTA